MSKHVLDIYEPWLGPGYSTYDAEGFAELEGMSASDWVARFSEATAERGGEIVYEGDPADRPQWLKDHFAEVQAAARRVHQERDLGDGG